MAQASASRPADRVNLYQQITERIIAELEVGRVPWVSRAADLLFAFLPDLTAANDDEDDPDGDPAMALAGRIAA